MWDEKKFFEDYVKESEKIKPDERFIEQLKQMADREEKRKKPVPMIKYVAIAASFLVCIGLGHIVWRSQNIEPKEKNAEYKVELQAGYQETEKEDISAEEGIELERDVSGQETLTMVLNYMKQGETIRDENGDEVSQERQEELYQLLKEADEAEMPEDGELENTYFLEEDQMIEIEVWENGFFKINGYWYY